MQLGMIGLGRMGANMVRRLIKNGHECVVYDRSPQVVNALVNENAVGASSQSALVKQLRKPRAVWLMVPAAVVDKAIADLVPLLESGDESDFVKSIDEYIARTEMKVPEEALPTLRDGFDLEELPEIDLKSAGISNVILGDSYDFDFSFVKLPVVDGDGYPIQRRGVTNYPGLYFVGLPWLHNAKSGLIHGVGQDADYIVTKMRSDDRVASDAQIPDTPDKGWLSHDLCCS